jgi:hypothetical protein
MGMKVEQFLKEDLSPGRPTKTCLQRKGEKERKRKRKRTEVR